MIKQLKWFLIFILLSVIKIYSQSTFHLLGNAKEMTLKFKLINNLILIPVELNQKKFTFILDTGVSKSLLFNVESADSLKMRNLEVVRVRGLGALEYFEAKKSKHNSCRISQLYCSNFEIYLIEGKQFDFSARMGENVHGLIGYDLLKNFVVEINYNKKILKFYKKENYKYRKCRKCKIIPISFQKNKPYINTYVSNNGKKKVKTKLLIDSGSGDALWLFTNDKIQVPNKYFEDFLGTGLSGEIHGKKALQKQIQIQDFVLKNVLTSFPDSKYIVASNSEIERNGILGSEILKRFHIILDYPNKQISLRKNSNYKKTFYYNRSGLDVIYNGKILVKIPKKNFSKIQEFNQTNKTVSISLVYNYEFKNSYIIEKVKENSPAMKAGLEKGDIIKSINGNPAYFYSLKQIIQKLSNSDKRNVRLRVIRNGFEYTFKFYLEDLL